MYRGEKSGGGKGGKVQRGRLKGQESGWGVGE